MLSVRHQRGDLRCDLTLSCFGRTARRRMPNNNLVTVEVEYVFGDLLTRDVPGIEDALWHLLERSRVLLNDRCPVNVMWKAASSDRDALVCV